MACTRWLMAHVGLIAIALCLLLASAMVPNVAFAQVKNCSVNTSGCSLAEAMAACNAFVPGAGNNNVSGGVTRKVCNKDGGATSGRVIMQYWGRQSGSTGEGGPYLGGIWYWTNKCSVEPSYTGTGPWSSGGAAKSGSLGCRNMCDGIWGRNADSSMTWQATGGLCPDDEKGTCDNYGSGYYWNAILNVCEPPEGKCGGRPQNSLGQCAPEPCPEGMTLQADGTCKNKTNECPAGQIKSPDGKCLPGDGQCAQGEVRGKDGTCKKDSDGDGEPDEGEEGGEGSDGKKRDEFSGGDDCKTPPTCSGSPIMCGQARIQWRIDCNTRRNRNIAGGTCSTPPVCTGEKCDALEYTGLLMQWRTACATEKLAQGNNGNAGAQPEWTKVGGMSTDPGAGSSPDDLKVLTTKTLSVSDLDQSGIGGGGSCMGFASGGSNGITSGFMSAISTPPPFFCQYIAQIKALIITIAAVAAAVILARGGN